MPRLVARERVLYCPDMHEAVSISIDVLRAYACTPIRVRSRGTEAVIEAVDSKTRSTVFVLLLMLIPDHLWKCKVLLHVSMLESSKEIEELIQRIVKKIHESVLENRLSSTLVG